MKKRMAALAAVTLCGSLALCGCRPSDALNRDKYNYREWSMFSPVKTYVPDDDPDTEENGTEKESEDPSHDYEQAVSGQQDEGEAAEKAVKLSYDPDAGASAAGAVKVNPDKVAAGILTSSSLMGDLISDGSVLAGGLLGDGAADAGDGGDEDEAVQLADNNGSAKDADITDRPDDEEGDEDETGGSDTEEDKSAEIVDDDDPDSEKKKIVSGAGRVAAVGEAAAAVCMLAGTDALCATDTDFLDNSLAQQAFPVDEEDCAVLWDGDGSSALSDEEFDELLEIAPDACFYISGTDAFTEEQLGELDDADIAYYPLSFASADGVETAVYTMGKALGDEAEDKAEEYSDWCSALKRELSGLDDVDTIFIQEWDDTAVTAAYNSKKEEIYYTDEGMAVIRVGTAWDRAFLDFAEEYAGVTDRTKEPAKWSADYDVCTADGSLCLVSMIKSVGNNAPTQPTLEISGRYELLTGYQRTSTSSGYVTSAYDYPGRYLLTGLGHRNFPAVIVKNSEVKKQLEAASLWDYGSYCTDYNGNNSNYVTDADGSTHVTETSGWFTICSYRNTAGIDIGLIVPDSTSTAATVIKGYAGITCCLFLPGYTAANTAASGWTYTYDEEYDKDYGVYVNPAGGVGSWMDGSPESVLEAVWAASVVSGYDEDLMYEKIREFYSTFYGLELSDNAIYYEVLAGE